MLKLRKACAMISVFALVVCFLQTSSVSAVVDLGGTGVDTPKFQVYPKDVNGSVVSVEGVSFDFSEPGTVRATVTDGLERAIIITKSDDSWKFTFKFKNGDRDGEFAFPFVSGVFALESYSHLDGTHYKLSERCVIDYIGEDFVDEVFLGSNDMYNWDISDQYIQDALELEKKCDACLSGGECEDDCVTKMLVEVLDYMRARYNYSLGANDGIYRSLDGLYDSRKGVCVDFSRMYACMLRSLKIPTRVVFGYTGRSKEYHSWNLVMVDKKWITVDPTAVICTKQLDFASLGYDSDSITQLF